MYMYIHDMYIVCVDDVDGNLFFYGSDPQKNDKNIVVNNDNEDLGVTKILN